MLLNKHLTTLSEEQNGTAVAARYGRQIQVSWVDKKASDVSCNHISKVGGGGRHELLHGLYIPFFAMNCNGKCDSQEQITKQKA